METSTHREPLITLRRKSRGFLFARYNPGSAEVEAMNAHLRVAYGGRKASSPGRESGRSLLELSREYDSSGAE